MGVPSTSLLPTPKWSSQERSASRHAGGRRLSLIDPGSPSVVRPRRATILDHPDPLAQHPVETVPSSTRRVSASFATREPPSSYPSMATSSLTADCLTSSHTYNDLPLPYTYQKNSRKVTPSTATTYTTATVYPHSPFGNENIPPSASMTSLSTKHKDSIDLASAKLRQKSKPRQGLSTIPKSRTLNVFSNLTSSISRASLVSLNRTTSTSSTAESESSSSFLSRRSTIVPGPDANPRHIHSAQSSAYWTGRFLALQDRFHSEMLLPENLTTLITAHAERSIVPGHKSRHSKTISASSTSARKSLDAQLLANEENRSRRVFLHLEALCATSEAKKSLHAWQQTYARRVGKEELLPRGGSMDDKGWMGRLLGRSGAAGKRGSIASIA